MSRLSYSEMEGCRNLLGLLDNDDIMALCDTITNRLVQPEDRQDAIRAILVYSQSVEELLRRKKIHREVIFKYLATQGVIIPPATEKHSLIQHAKDYWKKHLQPKLKETPEPVKTEDIRLFQQQEKEDKNAEKVDFRRLGEEFCHWFFELLNSQNPFLGPPQDEWGPQHFWHDVKLRFYYNTSEQNVIDYHGAEIAGDMRDNRCWVAAGNRISQLAMQSQGRLLIPLEARIWNDILFLSSYHSGDSSWKMKLDSRGTVHI
ncbi:uncharacterized protein C3orf38 homolog isoform X4 [Crocuta crocuta]